MAGGVYLPRKGRSVNHEDGCEVISDTLIDPLPEESETEGVGPTGSDDQGRGVIVCGRLRADLTSLTSASSSNRAVSRWRNTERRASGTATSGMRHRIGFLGDIGCI